MVFGRQSATAGREPCAFAPFRLCARSRPSAGSKIDPAQLVRHFSWRAYANQRSGVCGRPGVIFGLRGRAGEFRITGAVYLMNAADMNWGPAPPGLPPAVSSRS